MKDKAAFRQLIEGETSINNFSVHLEELLEEIEFDVKLNEG